MNSKMLDVAIIDYKLGNLYSVLNACKKVGLTAEITSDKALIQSARAAILPGVGAFGDAMQNLHDLDLASPIKDFVASGKPVMGVCLGLQLLFDESEEFGSSKGLGIVPGFIRKFPNISEGIKLRVPQISWNTISKVSGELWERSPLSNIKEGEFMYFVHSYYVVPNNKEVVLSNTIYENISYCSSILSDNIFATQFHPEKSAGEGIKIYENWAFKINKRESIA